LSAGVKRPRTRSAGVPTRGVPGDVVQPQPLVIRKETMKGPDAPTVAPRRARDNRA